MNLITSIVDIKSKNLDWVSIGKRFREFREHMNLSRTEAGSALDLGKSTIVQLESANHNRSTVNIIWTIVNTWDLSLNWLLNGIGSFHDADPIELLPETLMIEKGAGIRRSKHRIQAEEGTYSDDMLEFVTAIDKFKQHNKINFPSWTQIYEIILALGYQKSAPSRIAPLKYAINNQKKKEQTNQQTTTPEEIDAIKKEENCHKKWVPADSLKTLKPKKKTRKTRKSTTTESIISSPEKNKEERDPSLVESEDFIITDPDGNQYEIQSANFLQFCTENKLQPFLMRSVIDGHRIHHKNWKARMLLKQARS